MIEPNEQQSAAKPALIDYLIIICKWKRLIVATALSFTVIAAIAVLLLPSVYLAETRILPPFTNDSMAITTQLMGQSAGLPGGISLPGGLGKSTNELYVGLLQSRTLLDRIVERFRLAEVYKVQYREDARKKLVKALHISNDRKSGLISIGVEDRNSKQAADMAAAFVEELTRITQEVALTEAAQRRLFFENKLKEVKNSLITSEEAMKGFQEKTGAIELKEQTKVIIEASAHLRANIAAKEVSLSVLKTYAKSQNPDVQKTEDELRALKQQLAKLDQKTGNTGDNLFTTGSILNAGTGYIRNVRNLKYNETLFELLLKQYEMAKMDESRNSTSIQVIDKAVAPEKRVWPKRTKTVTITALIGTLIGMLMAFLMENRERMAKDPVSRAKIDSLKQYALFNRHVS